MGTTKKKKTSGRKDFIGFILKAEKSKEITLKFLSKGTATELKVFFDEEGYTEISAKDCEDILKIIRNSDGLSVGIPNISLGDAVKSY